MQEAELKHSRIAMVSVLLWPLSELDSVLGEIQGDRQKSPVEVVTLGWNDDPMPTHQNIM